jgi:hypothetical protein
VSLIRIFARLSPNGTEAADGAIGPVLGIRPNGAYVNRNPLASYIDPDLPWPATRDAYTPDAASRATALARLFRRAHAADWCAAQTAADLEALRARAQNASLDAAARSASCEVCVEQAALHLRVGTAQHWNTGDEAFCAVAAPQSVAIYQAGRDRNEAAAAWCGCAR